MPGLSAGRERKAPGNTCYTSTPVAGNSGAQAGLRPHSLPLLQADIPGLCLPQAILILQDDNQEFPCLSQAALLPWPSSPQP